MKKPEKKLRREILKRVGDLDYSKRRHSYTPLSDEELGYCETDVLVDMEYIAECIEDEKGIITKIPLTKTGYVRRYVRKECFSNKGDKYAHAKYRKLMNVLQLTLEEYETAKRAFAGGFTHSNVLNTGIIHHNVASYDIASSYPTVMVAEDRFPMSRGRKVHIRSKNEFQWYLSRFACVFDVEFEHIRSTTRIDHIISASKCYVLENPEIDNGRIIRADRVRITVTEIDFEMFSKFYTWDTVRVGDLWYYHRGYLPTPFVKSILTLYGNKTTLKGVQGKEDEYMRSKEMCNSAYGMCVTDIIRQDSTYSESWIDTPPDEEKQIEEYNTNPMRFISYLWGVYVTALARRNILSAIISIGDDYIYSDTDSVKFTNLQDHESYFDTYNKWIDERCAVAMEYHNLPVEMTRPLTKDGVEKPLGHFEYEGCYDQFKTLGAKRYALIKNGEFSITVSGVNKKTAVPYLIQKYGITGVMKEFDNDLVIPDHNDLKHDIYDRNGMEITNPCGKLTHLYIDEEFTASITDYKGVECEIHELSCVNLSPAAYSLGIDELYYNLIMHAHDEQNERI